MSDDDLPPGFRRITPASAPAQAVPAQAAAAKEDDLPPGFRRITPAAPMAQAPPTPGMFDDLIPQQKSGMFDDLIPKKAQPNLGYQGEILHGMPIVGPLVEKATAATRP
jgi:hypothetical protein